MHRLTATWRSTSRAVEVCEAQTKPGFKLKALLCSFHNQTLMKLGGAVKARVKLAPPPPPLCNVLHRVAVAHHKLGPHNRL